MVMSLRSDNCPSLSSCVCLSVVIVVDNNMSVENDVGCHEVWVGCNGLMAGLR